MPPSAESQAKRQKLSAASGAPPAVPMHTLLGIPEQQPECMDMPSDDQMMTGVAPTPYEYMKGLVPHVKHRLSVWLHKNKNIQLQQPLHTLQTPQIETAASGATAYKERWNMENCEKSLQRNELYEAAMTAHQFDLHTNNWNGRELGAEQVTWTQLNACTGFWTQAALTASAEKDKTRRLIFPGMLPTCIKTLWEVSELMKKGQFFKQLPACGGHAILWSWFIAMGEALSREDEALILALHEAGLNVTVRMRLNPSQEQVALDQLSFVDALRMGHVAAGATSNLEFAVLVCGLTNTLETDTGPMIEKKVTSLGIQFRGKPVTKGMCYTISAVAGFHKKEHCLKAVRFLERANSNALANPDKIQRIMACIKKHANVNEADHVLVFLMEVMGVTFLCGDATDETYAIDKLVGAKRGESGFVQYTLAKFRFVGWFLNAQMNHAASGATAALSIEGLEKIKGKVESVLQFYREFAKMDKKSEVVQDVITPSIHTTYLQPCSAWSGFQQQGPIQGLLIHMRVFVATCSSDFQNSFHDPDPHFFEVQFSFRYVVSNIAIHMKTRLHISKYYCKAQLVPHLRMVNTMLGLGERVKRVGE